MSTIKTILYAQKTLKNGQHPVMLYVYEDKPYRISLGYSTTPKEWDDAQGRFRKNVENYKVKNLNLRKFELRASEIIDDFVRQGKRFDFPVFKQLFTGEEAPEKTFTQFFREMIEEKKALGKAGTMIAYQDALRAMQKFKHGEISFAQVDYSFLKEMEVYLFQRGCTSGGIGAYMRAIRAVYYEGIRRGLCVKESNPFSTTMNKSGYSLAKLRPAKNPKSLAADEIESLKEFDYASYPRLASSWRLFMFSFRMFGMNFIDMCNLTKENVQHGRIIYARQKTGKVFNLRIKPEAQEILDYFHKDDSKYLFPIYNEHVHITPMQKKDRTKKVLKKVNSDLKEIATLLHIETPITFYVARHTSATTLKRNGVANELISEALGHSNPAITQLYLKKFDNAVLDEAMSKL